MKLNYTHNMIKTLKKEKMDYDTLLSMNQLWQDYITELMNNSNNEENILSKILKADLHGAILTVINSTNKNNIGISGIVLFESRRTFNLLNKKNEIKTILKNGCVFETEMKYNGMKIIIYGDNFIYKSADEELKNKIDDVENELKEQKKLELQEFVEEHCKANNVFVKSSNGA